MILERLPEVVALTEAEKLLLAEEIWRSVSTERIADELTDDQRDLLDARWQAFLANPAAGSPWQAVRQRVFGH